MSVNNIVIPSGILAAWQGPQLPDYDNPVNENENENENEAFDVTKVARRRARTLSVSLDRQGYGRENTLEQLASVVRLKDNTLNSLKRGLPDQPRYVSSVQWPKRSTTINLGDLSRSRNTDLSTVAGPGPRLDRTSSTLFPTRPKPLRRRLRSDVGRGLDDSYVFQSLGNDKVPERETAQVNSNPPVFLARNSSKRTNISRRESSRKDYGRSQSNTSQPSTNNVIRRASVAVQNVVEKVNETVTSAFRRSSLQELYEKAKIRQVQLKRSNMAQLAFEYTYYLILLATVYFVFVGVPFWSGLVLTIYYLFDMKLVVPAGTAIFLGIGFLYAYLPLLILFEKPPPEVTSSDCLSLVENGRAKDTALLIPCYKSEALIGATLEAALKIFPAQNIFVIANGNSPTPLDNTVAVCERYGVSHTWSPIGSKIVAQFVGCYVAKQFPYTLLIDDDCLLPPNFPIVTDRIRGKVLCIGYTIKSVGPDSNKGTLCQQAQDVEYKLSGIQRAFAGKVGSATFPHGAISIWDRECLIKTFQAHPGFSVSEDWFFGHVARQLGCRIQMCTAVFVETETPSAVFFSSGRARGGFGEMTIWKQRFFRWNYFFVSGLYWDLSYIIRNWKLGWWEIGAKLFVFQEVYETLLYLLAPFVLPISFYVRPEFSGYLYVATLVLYQINVIIFNYVHLRARQESVTVLCLMYYLPYKIVLGFINIASCYYSIYKYAKYFAKRHPKVIEDEKAVAVVLRLEEESYSDAKKVTGIGGLPRVDSVCRARRFTVTAVGTTLSSVAQEPQANLGPADTNVVDFAVELSPVAEDHTPTAFREPFSKAGRIPPPIPPSRRPYSWQQRTTSNTSSNSNVSPLEERKKPRFPIPTSESDVAGKPLQREASAPDGQPSPTLPRPSSAMNLSGRSSSTISWQVRRSSDAPRLSPPPGRSSPAFTRFLCHDFRSDSPLTYDIHTPTIERPPPVMASSNRHFVVVSSSRNTGGGWPLPDMQPDDSRYIMALADTGNQDHARRSMDWLIIDEDDEEEGAMGEDDETLRGTEEFEARESMQTDRSHGSRTALH
ncbi:MAG: hypothetical protein Q9188_000958 [Gyalolechia gomerana]